MYLVADVGGTNTRLALVRGTQVLTPTLAGFGNHRFASFDDLLGEYLAGQGAPAVAGCCIAIAGPVTSHTARLTNRDWAFDRDGIGRILGCGQVRLINDLAALGHALPALGGGSLLPVRAATGRRRLNGQAIVVGVGTGFNLCLTRRCGDGIVVVEAEAGHGTLTTSIAVSLADAIGSDPAAGFRTFEDCFSGRGLSRLHGAVSGGRDLTARDIIAAGRQGGAARRTLDLMAGLLGRCVAELIHFYLPLDGVYLAGGVARGIFGTDARARFLRALDGSEALAEDYRHIPVSVIADDAAALQGCAAVLAADRAAGTA